MGRREGCRAWPVSAPRCPPPGRSRVLFLRGPPRTCGEREFERAQESPCNFGKLAGAAARIRGLRFDELRLRPRLGPADPLAAKLCFAVGEERPVSGLRASTTAGTRRGLGRDSRQRRTPSAFHRRDQMRSGSAMRRVDILLALIAAWTRSGQERREGSWSRRDALCSRRVLQQASGVAPSEIPAQPLPSSAMERSTPLASALI